MALFSTMGAGRAPDETLTDKSCPRKAGMIDFAAFYGNPLQKPAAG
jgi:hypothetical protein